MIAQAYVALALIKAKSKIFGEHFVTISELNQFTIFMQREFNERDLGIAIVSELGIKDFDVKCGIVTVTNSCCYDLDRLPAKILSIFTDESLILQFFMGLENERLEVLKSLQTETSKLCTSDKMLSLVLPKASGKGISNLKY